MYSNRKTVYGSGNRCPVCNGTGVELYTKMIANYGPAEYARECTRCHRSRYLRIADNDENMPSQYRNVELSDFDFGAYSCEIDKMQTLMYGFVSQYGAWAESGKGLYLWSRTSGSGKSFLSCCLANSLMQQYDLQVRFVSVPDYLDMVGGSYRRQPEEPDASEIYRKCDLLILDDIGAQNKGEWQNQELFRLVNARMNGNRVSIFTANMPPEQLNVDNRIIDRILKMTVVLQMPEESVRLKKAKSEQNQFVEKMLKIKR